MNALGHAWSISSPPAVFSITRAIQIALIPPYSFMLTEDNGNSITSTLSLTVFAGFNGAVITCRDANALPEDAAKQQWCLVSNLIDYITMFGNTPIQWRLRVGLDPLPPTFQQVGAQSPHFLTLAPLPSFLTHFAALKHRNLALFRVMFGISPPGGTITSPTVLAKVSVGSVEQRLSTAYKLSQLKLKGSVITTTLAICS